MWAALNDRAGDGVEPAMLLKMNQPGTRSDGNGSVQASDAVSEQSLAERRAAEISDKHAVVTEFLKVHNFSALLLQHPSNFAWFTAGSDCLSQSRSDLVAALFITPQARVIACSNIDSGQIFERELRELGFQLKERPWFEPRQVLIDDLCYGRAVASDSGFGRTTNVSPYLAAMRLQLGDSECDRARQAGRLVTHAVEATARNLQRGQTESEIAGELAHRLIKYEVIPERIEIWGDGRGQRYRHWSYGADRVSQRCVVSAVGRHQGLCAGVSRTVCFGDLPNEQRDEHYHALLFQATGMYFTKSGRELVEIWERVQTVYERLGLPFEWKQAEQAEIIGYERCELPIVPGSEFRLPANTPIYWHPTVGSAKVGDTVLAREDGFQLLTPTENWPTIQIEVKGQRLLRPDILRRQHAKKKPTPVPQAVTATRQESQPVVEKTPPADRVNPCQFFDDQPPLQPPAVQPRRRLADTDVSLPCSAESRLLGDREIEQTRDSQIPGRQIPDGHPSSETNPAPANGSTSEAIRTPGDSHVLLDDDSGVRLSSPSQSGVSTSADTQSAPPTRSVAGPAADQTQPTLPTPELVPLLDTPPTPELGLDEPAPTAEPAPTPEPAIDMNTFDWTEWVQVDGIGEALARAIIDERESVGAFENLVDLAARVPGIGPKKLDQMGPWVE